MSDGTECVLLLVWTTARTGSEVERVAESRRRRSHTGSSASQALESHQPIAARTDDARAKRPSFALARPAGEQKRGRERLILERIQPSVAATLALGWRHQPWHTTEDDG